MCAHGCWQSEVGFENLTALLLGGYLVAAIGLKSDEMTKTYQHFRTAIRWLSCWCHWVYEILSGLIAFSPKGQRQNNVTGNIYSRRAYLCVHCCFLSLKLQLLRGKCYQANRNCLSRCIISAGSLLAKVKQQLIGIRVLITGQLLAEIKQYEKVFCRRAIRFFRLQLVLVVFLLRRCPPHRHTRNR